MSANLHWLLLSENYFINMDKNINFCVLIMDGKGGNLNEQAEYMKLFS
jgi:hypothetical protein